jgi:O-methyltransferase
MFMATRLARYGLPIRLRDYQNQTAAISKMRATWTFDTLAISLDEVYFSRYGLLDERVRFLKGWFKDTLPTALIERLAILRLDGDMYSSTMDVLKSLYPKLSSGGFAIIDDYGAVEGCRKAVTDFREHNKINDPILPIDWTGVYWRKT